jgi:hypothetical protein
MIPKPLLQKIVTSLLGPDKTQVYPTQELYIAICVTCRSRFSFGEEIPAKCRGCGGTPKVVKLSSPPGLDAALAELGEGAR